MIKAVNFDLTLAHAFSIKIFHTVSFLLIIINHHCDIKFCDHLNAIKKAPLR